MRKIENIMLFNILMAFIVCTSNAAIISGCKTTDPSGMCTECETGYILIANRGICIQISGITQTSSTTSILAGESTTASNSIKTSTFINSDVNCKIVNPAGGCSTCNDNFFYNAVSKLCQALTSYCAEWNNFGICSKCLDGYTLINNICIPISNSNTYSYTAPFNSTTSMDFTRGQQLNNVENSQQSSITYNTNTIISSLNGKNDNLPASSQTGGSSQVISTSIYLGPNMSFSSISNPSQSSTGFSSSTSATTTTNVDSFNSGTTSTNIYTTPSPVVTSMIFINPV